MLQRLWIVIKQPLVMYHVRQYEVYCGIGEILFLAQSKGVSGRAMVELEEKVAKCLSVKWREYDIPGDLVY